MLVRHITPASLRCFFDEPQMFGKGDSQ